MLRNLFRRIGIVILFFSLGLPFRIQAQSSLDSLENLLCSELEDSIRLSVLNQLAYYYDADSLKVSRYSFEAISLAETREDYLTLSTAYTNLGWMYLQRGYYPQSKWAWDLGIQAAAKTTNRVAEARACNGMGMLYEAQGLYDQALEYHLRSLKILEEENYGAGLAAAYSNIGVIYVNLNNFETARAYYRKAIELDSLRDDKSGLASDYNNLATSYQLEEKPEQALEYILKSFELKKELGDQRQLASAYSNLGEVYYQLGDFAKSIEASRKSLAIYEELQVKTRMANPLNNLGLALAGSGNFPKGLESAQRGLAFAKEIGESIAIQASLSAIAEIHRLSGNHEMAYESYITYQEYLDSLNAVEHERKMAYLMADYRFQTERDSLNTVQKEERNLFRTELDDRAQQQFSTYILLALSVALLLVVLWFFREKSKSNRILRCQAEALEKAQQEIEIRNDELEALNASKDRVFSIVAHDLRSPINSLQGLMMLFNSSTDLSPAELKDYVSRLTGSVESIAGLLENLLFWAKTQMRGTAELNPEGQNLELFVEESLSLLAEGARQKDLEMQMSIPSDLPRVKVDADVLRFLLRNLLNNAHKFSRPKGRINLGAEVQGDAIKVSIQDEGVGMDEARCAELFENFVSSSTGTNSEAGTGLGLMLCKEFLCLSGGTIGVESELGKGSTFWFSLPQA